MKEKLNCIIVSVLAVILVFVLSSCGASDSKTKSSGKFIFRDGVTFGQSVEEVKKAESEKNGIEPAISGGPYHDRDYVYSLFYYMIQLPGFKHACINYEFDGKGLNYMQYDLVGTTESYQDAHVAYDIMKTAMTEQYDAPIFSENGSRLPYEGRTMIRYCSGWDSSKISSYSQWVVEYDDYFVLIELIMTKSNGTLGNQPATYHTYVGYEPVSKDVMSPILKK